MACKMSSDPTGNDDFLAPTGASITLCFTSASGLYKLTAATYADEPLTVVNDSCVSFNIKPGRNTLFLTQLSPDPGITVEIFEDCGDGSRRNLGQRPFVDLDGYRINGQ